MKTQQNDKQAGHRCEAYKECAYYAYQQIDGKWYCDNCARFLRKMEAASKEKSER